jgi:predicted HTH transcriptional regulator
MKPWVAGASVNTNESPSGAIARLVEDLCNHPHESEWLEFKVDNRNPTAIGEYVSALANSAALCGRSSAYLVWGIEDINRNVIGTSFDPSTAKVGNEELLNWLLHLLDPQVHCQFRVAEADGRRVVVLEIESAKHAPVRFKNEAFIRVGTYKKRLRDHVEIERRLWKTFDQSPFEAGIAREGMSDSATLAAIDYSSYFDLLRLPAPDGNAGILAALEADRLVRRSTGGTWDITNLGAVLFAKQIADFPTVARKAVRVVQYPGTSRVESLRELPGRRGYASGFENLNLAIASALSTHEIVEQGVRRNAPTYPELALRELIANAFVHQDFTISGAGPMIEIFADRIEITNPGKPLVSTERFLDSPPRSRNEGLAALLRRMGICEERGSGWDRVVSLTEAQLLPAPLAEAPGENTRVVMFGPRPLMKMDRPDRVRAVYLHACLRYVSREFLTNSSLRTRFGIEPRNIASASRLIGEAVEAGQIVADDPSAPPKLRRYVPAWSKDEGQG